MPTNKEQKNLTKKFLGTALIDLMTAEDFSDITVTAVSRHAGVSRAAFYRSFKNTNEVLNYFIYSLFSPTYEQIDYAEKKVTWFDFLEKNLQIVASHKKEFSILFLSKKGDALLNIITKLSYNFCQKIFKQSPSNVYWYFLCGGINNMVEYWVTNTEQVDFEELLRSAYSSLEPHIKV